MATLAALLRQAAAAAQQRRAAQAALDDAAAGRRPPTTITLDDARVYEESARAASAQQAMVDLPFSTVYQPMALRIELLPGDPKYDMYVVPRWDARHHGAACLPPLSMMQRTPVRVACYPSRPSFDPSWNGKPMTVPRPPRERDVPDAVQPRDRLPDLDWQVVPAYAPRRRCQECHREPVEHLLRVLAARGQPVWQRHVCSGCLAALEREGGARLASRVRVHFIQPSELGRTVAAASAAAADELGVSDESRGPASRAQRATIEGDRAYNEASRRAVGLPVRASVAVTQDDQPDMECALCVLPVEYTVNCVYTHDGQMKWFALHVCEFHVERARQRANLVLAA